MSVAHESVRAMSGADGLPAPSRASRYYRRRSEETRGDTWAGWGPCVYLFEVGLDGRALRQVEQYDDGPTLRYEAGDDDEYGFLTVSTFDTVDWAEFEVSPDIFAEAWSSPGPR